MKWIEIENKYPFVFQAMKELYFDNVPVQKGEPDLTINSNLTDFELSTLNSFLSTLTETQIRTICVGEYNDIMDIIKSKYDSNYIKIDVNDILDHIFNNLPVK